MDRRSFAKNMLATGSGIMLFSSAGIPSVNFSTPRNLKRGIMWATIGVGQTIAEKFNAVKDAGFDGIEVYSHLDRDEVIKAKQETGLAIPSVCGALHGKFPLSHPDPSVREQGIEALRVTIGDASVYGADTVLLVPGRVSSDVDYDDCWNRSVEEIKKVIPLAEKLKVQIAIENVWNNFLLSPLEAAQYVDQFGSEFVKFYFDCGNILFIGWPEQWIKILGKRIAKVHIKEYSTKLADTQGKRAGFNVRLTEGDVNWPAVMKALDDNNYTDWVITEQPGGDSPQGLADLRERLEKIISI